MYRRGDFVHIWAEGYWGADLVGRVGQVIGDNAYEVRDDDAVDEDDCEIRIYLTVETRPDAYSGIGQDEQDWDEFLPESLGPSIPGDDLSPWLIAELTK